VAFDVFERHTDVGGLWDIDNPGTPVYESAHFISSKTRSSFTGYPMPATFPDYPRRDQILSYVRGFADHYGLRPHISFGAVVDRAVPDAEGVMVSIGGSTRRYRGIVCATGMNWTPNLAAYPGTFSGRLRHSVEYKHPREFEGKRVLLVGLGNSGADIACDAAARAQHAVVSVRRGYHFLPKHLFGKPTDVFAATGPKLPHWLELPLFELLQRWIIGDTTALGMPKPDHRLLETHPLLNDQLLHHLRHGNISLKGDIDHFDGPRVVFQDGTSQDFDDVLLCTGYQRSIPYIDSEHLAYEGAGLAHVLTCFSKKYPSLFTLGYAEINGALFPHAERLAQLVAEYAHALINDPSAASRFRELIVSSDWKLSGPHQLVNSPRHQGYADSDTLEKYTRRVFRQMAWSVPSAKLYPMLGAPPRQLPA
jgi:Flavin-binding monooxygenase-like